MTQEFFTWTQGLLVVDLNFVQLLKWRVSEWAEWPPPQVQLHLGHTKHQLLQLWPWQQHPSSHVRGQAWASCLMHALIPDWDFLPPQETWCKHLRSHCLEPLWFYYEVAWINNAIKLAKKASELCSINHEKGHVMSTIIISRMGCSSLRNLFLSCSINLDF